MRIFAAVIALVLNVAPARAADRYVVHGAAISQFTACRGVMWRAGAVVHNRDVVPMQVRLVGGSAGVFTVPIAVNLPAGASRVAKAGELAGTPAPLLYVTKLEVPEGVEIEGRLDVYGADLCSFPPPIPYAIAKIAMPVYERLAAAGEVQHHFGADLGTGDVRLNVGVYNGGGQSANVMIRARRPLCEIETTVTQTATIAANTIVQIALPHVPPCNSGDELNPAWSTEITVEADQPSLSFVSVISTDPTAPIFAAVVP